MEGPDDHRVVMALTTGAGAMPNFDVKVAGGIRPLLELVPVIVQRSGLRQLAIVVDADAAVLARRDAVFARLEKVGYGVRHLPPQPGGTIVRAAGRPTVGVWLMPDNSAAGMLEDFAASLVPPGDPLWRHAETAVDGIPEPHRRFPMAHRAKALIHTWLAWQEEPGKPLGTAITARYLDATTPTAHAFAAWLSALFAPASADDGP